MKVALVYDRVNKVGGAEKILQSLHHIWPDAPLYTSVYDSSDAGWAKGITVIPSFLQRLPGARRHHEWLFWAMPIAFETFDFSSFDVVISVSSAEAKGVITKPATLHIHYCLTPTKYLYSQRQLHLKANPLGKIGEIILRRLWHYQTRWDQIAAQRADILISISRAVSQRCQIFYHRASDAVIYPPVDTKPGNAKTVNPLGKPYYLLVSRLVPSKRVELAIKTFNQLGNPLVIVGIGSQMNDLQNMASANIIFTGYVSPEKLRQYYQHCLAFIHPGEEDFGIAMVEALSAGKPVIAYQKGGAGEIIDHGVHGLLFDRPRVSSIMESVVQCQSRRFSPAVLRKRAARFSRKIFESTFEQFVRKAWQTHYRV